MYINIAVPARLNLLRRHEKLLIQLFIQLIENQASLRRNERRIRIGVFLVTNVHNRLALFIDVVQHTDKILLIVTIIPITFCHNRLDLLQRTLYYIVHDRNGHCICIHLFHFCNDILTYMSFFFIGEFCQCTVGRFPHRIDYLLYIKSLSATVLFNDPCLTARLKFHTVIHCIFFFHHRCAHFPTSIIFLHCLSCISHINMI